MAAPSTKAQYQSAILKILVATDPKANTPEGKAQAKSVLQGMSLPQLKSFYATAKQKSKPQAALIQRAMGQAASQQQKAGVTKRSSRTSHSSRGKGTARSRSNIQFKSKTGGMTTKASKAASVGALRDGLKKAGVKGVSGKSRAQLQAMATQAQRKSTTRTAVSSGKTQRTIGGVSAQMRKDYNRVRSLLTTGRILDLLNAKEARGGKISVALRQQAANIKDLEQMPFSDPSDRYKAWLEKYKPVLKAAGLATGPGRMGTLLKSTKSAIAKSKSKSKGRKSRKSGRKSISSRFGAIAQQQRVPYYIAPAPKARRRAPFSVRAVPGTGAPAFSTLDRAEQSRILARLNGTSKSLRSKGAPRAVNAGDLFAYYDKTGKYAPKPKKSASQDRGAANRWY